MQLLITGDEWAGEYFVIVQGDQEIAFSHHMMEKLVSMMKGEQSA
jgi:hypothetical protein